MIGDVIINNVIKRLQLEGASESYSVHMIYRNALLS